MNICESLTNTARIFPDHVALVWNDERITYRELNALSAAAAFVLREAGVQSGDRVALMLPNAPAFPIWYYAALRLGAIAVSVSTRLADSEVAFLLEDCGARAFVSIDREEDAAISGMKSLDVDASGRLVNEEPLDPANGTIDGSFDANPHDAALILYTSGTTGFAKGATLTHANVRSNVAAFNHLCNMRSHDRILLAVPLFHCFGQNALLNSALNVGATLVLQSGFDLNESKRLIAAHEVTQFYGVPMMFQLLLTACEPGDLQTVNYCFSAAATLPVQVGRDWFEKFGLPIHEGYGLTETSPFASYNHRDRFVPGSIGTPIDNVEMKIVDTETGENCSPGVLGEIAIRGPNVMTGYWNRPDDTAAAIRDGWFHSGDIGRCDEDGFFYIVDRVKDMIAVGGLKVFPAEVERVLLDHPAVAQVAVVGTPDAVFGESVVAFVVLAEDESGGNDDAALEDIRTFSREHLGGYKVPRRISVIEQLPRNPSGKILKTTLREWAADTGTVTSDESAVAAVELRPASLQADLARAYPADRKRIATEFVQQLVQSIGELPDLPSADATFIETGLDSLSIVALSTQLQHEVGERVEVAATLVFDYPRLVDLAGYLLKVFVPDNDLSVTDVSANSSSRQQTKNSIQAEIETIQNMSEEDALRELMKELE